MKKTTPTKAKLRSGTRVFWNDPPDGTCSGPGVITSIKGDVFSIAKDDGGEVEALRQELKALPSRKPVKWEVGRRHCIEARRPGGRVDIIVQPGAIRSPVYARLIAAAPRAAAERGRLRKLVTELLDALAATTHGLEQWVEIADKEDARESDFDAIEKARCLIKNYGEPAHTLPVD